MAANRRILWLPIRFGSPSILQSPNWRKRLGVARCGPPSPGENIFTLRVLPTVLQVRSIASDTLQIEDIYEIGQLLGSGVAGEVHSAVHRETSKHDWSARPQHSEMSLLFCAPDAKVAIKTISKKKFLVNERSVTTTRVWLTQAIATALCRGGMAVPELTADVRNRRER